MTVTTDKCDKCEFGEIDYSDKSRITVYCKARDKKYFYGQRVPCDDRKEKNKNEG